MQLYRFVDVASPVSLDLFRRIGLLGVSKDNLHETGRDGSRLLWQIRNSADAAGRPEDDHDRLRTKQMVCRRLNCFFMFFRANSGHVLGTTVSDCLPISGVSKLSRHVKNCQDISKLKVCYFELTSHLFRLVNATEGRDGSNGNGMSSRATVFSDRSWSQATTQIRGRYEILVSFDMIEYGEVAQQTS